MPSRNATYSKVTDIKKKLREETVSSFFNVTVLARWCVAFSQAFLSNSVKVISKKKKNPHTKPDTLRSQSNTPDCTDLHEVCMG